MQSFFHRRERWIAACGVVLALGLAGRAKADAWDKMTILTVDQPVQVTDKLLQPGQYVFKLVDSASDRHIVQIFNRDQSQLIDTVMAIPDWRNQITGNSRFTFWETPQGTARALREWFYPGDNSGQEFPYPKQAYVLQARAATTTVTAPTPAPAPEPQAQPAPEPAPVTQPEAQERVPQTQPEQPAEIAQAAPPPAPPSNAAPEPAPQKPPSELPQTASPYPLFGISGLSALCLAGLLRLKRALN